MCCLLLRSRAARRALHIASDDLRFACFIIRIGIAETHLRIVLELLQIRIQRFRRSIALADVGAHRVHHDLIQPLGDAGHQLARCERHGIEVLHDHLQGGFAFKRQLAGQHFVHYDAQ